MMCDDDDDIEWPRFLSLAATNVTCWLARQAILIPCKPLTRDEIVSLLPATRDPTSPSTSGVVVRPTVGVSVSQFST